MGGVDRAVGIIPPFALNPTRRARCAMDGPLTFRMASLIISGGGESVSNGEQHGTGATMQRRAGATGG